MSRQNSTPQNRTGQARRHRSSFWPRDFALNFKSCPLGDWLVRGYLHGLGDIGISRTPARRRGNCVKRLRGCVRDCRPCLFRASSRVSPYCRGKNRGGIMKFSSRLLVADSNGGGRNERLFLGTMRVIIVNQRAPSSSLSPIVIAFADRKPNAALTKQRNARDSRTPC